MHTLLNAEPLRIAPTPRSEVFSDGTAKLYHFEPAGDPGRLPLLLVPSMINRWYIMDLRPGASLVEALVEQGFDVWLLDWGMPNDEDRHLTWGDVLRRLARMERRVRRLTGAPKVGLLGYCMGATLSAIHVALRPEGVAAFCNLLGPIDFSHSGLLGTLVDKRWFDPKALTAPGNLPAPQMQAGFVSLRPTSQFSKWVGLADRGHDPAAREAFWSLETWASDNIPFPASAYVTYIGELYQDNRLVAGTHRVDGQAVDLGQITCPVLTVTTESDTICPKPAAQALNELVGSTDTEQLVAKGGHVGAVVGSRAQRILYPGIGAWFKKRLKRK